MLLFDLFEARRKDLVYKDKVMKGVIERVTVELEGSESSVFSRAAKRYKQMDRLLDAIQEKRNELNGQVKDKVLEYFDDAADVIYTRVIDTVSMTATVSKTTPATPAGKDEVVDYEKVVKELMKLVPEIESKANELIKEFTSIKVIAAKPEITKLAVKFKDEDDKQKKLKGKLDDMLDEGLSDVWMAIKRQAKAIFDSMASWGKEYDKKLADIKKMASGKKVAEAEVFAKPIKAKTIVKKLRDSEMDEAQTEAIVKAMEGIDGDEVVDAKRMQQVAKTAKVNFEDIIQAIGLNESLNEANR